MHQHMANHVTNKKDGGLGHMQIHKHMYDSYANIGSHSETLNPRMHYNHRVH